MITIGVRKAALICGLILISLALAVQSAQPAKGVGSKIDLPLIISVFVDFNSNTVIINGENLKIEDVPEVILGNEKLNVVTNGNQEITAELPADIADGDYLLTVYTDDSLYDNYNLTIGAVGPPGEQGAKGGKGDPGLNCWDTNQDHLCTITLNPATNEDKNNDNACSVADCQCPSPYYRSSLLEIEHNYFYKDIYSRLTYWLNNILSI